MVLLGRVSPYLVFGLAFCVACTGSVDGDVGDGAVGEDGHVPDAAADARVPADGYVPAVDGGRDAMVIMDGAVVVDAAMPGDGAVSMDAAVPEDSAVPMDAAMTMDSAVPMDAAMAMDSAMPVDSGAMMDAGMPMDSGMEMDAGPTCDVENECGLDCCINGEECVNGTTCACDHDAYRIGTPLTELSAGANTGAIPFITTCATVQGNEPCYQACQIGSLWWNYKATADQTLNFVFTHRVEAALYTGNKLVALTRVTGTAWNGASSFEADLSAGTRYWLQVRPFDAVPQSFSISRDRGDNDMFSHAAPIMEPPAGESTGHIVVDSVDATVQPNEPCYQNCVGSLWWKYEATGAQTVNFTMSSSMEVAVYTGTALGNLVRVGGTAWNGASEFLMDLDPGTYWVQVRPLVSGSQWIDAKRAREDNDAFSHATAVTEVPAGGNSGAIEFNATTFTVQPSEPCFQVCTGSLWWSYTPTANQTLNFSASSSMEIAVYTGSSLGTLVRVGGTGWNGANQFVLNVAAGTTYSIQVRPFSNADESFTIARARADLDLFANASVLTEPSAGQGTGPVLFNNMDATNEPDEPCFQNCTPSLWWRFTPSASYLATVNLSATGEAIVYTGSTFANLQQVGGTGWNGGDHFSWNVTSGTTYFLQVRPYTINDQTLTLSRP